MGSLISECGPSHVKFLFYFLQWKLPCHVLHGLNVIEGLQVSSYNEWIYSSRDKFYFICYNGSGSVLIHWLGKASYLTSFKGWFTILLILFEATIVLLLLLFQYSLYLPSCIQMQIKLQTKQNIHSQ